MMYEKICEKPRIKKIIEELVDASLPDANSISFYNQALMELGALICIPKNPRCESCPIQKDCKAKDPGTLPVLSPLKKRRIEKKNIYIWVHEGKIHIHKRADTGLLAGLYEFDETLPKKDYTIQPLESYTHIFSHVEWQMDAYLVYCTYEDSNFYSIDEIEQKYALPSAFQPFFKQVKEKLK